MKKLISLILATMLICSILPAYTEETTVSVLVVVFSHAGENWQVGIIDEGNTMKMAKIIANKMNADLFEIDPVIPYPMEYEAVKTVAQTELDEDARPEYQGDVVDWARYETVFVGYPIWWGGMPKIVVHFLEDHDFAGKTVIPFNTHGGSGQGGTQSVIEHMLMGATVLQGLAVTGTQAQNDPEKTEQDVEVWLKIIGLAE